MAELKRGYLVTEPSELQWQQHNQALRAVGRLLEAASQSDSIEDVDPGDIASLFFVLADSGDRIREGAEFVSD